MIEPEKRIPALPPLEVYIVDVQRARGDEVEQYWIDGRSRKSAMRAAARFAGVALDKVLSASLHNNGE